MFTHLVAYDGSLYLLDRRGDSPDIDDDGEPGSSVTAALSKSWRFEQDRFVEINDREAQSVSESVRRARLRSDFPAEDSASRNPSSSWRVCTENVYLFNGSGRCPMNFGAATWALRFNRQRSLTLDGAISAQLVNSNDRESIRLTSDTNLWVETDAASYTTRQNKLLSAMRGRAGAHFTAAGPAFYLACCWH